MPFSLWDLLLPKEGKFYDYTERQAALLLEGCQLFDLSLGSLEGANAQDGKRYFALIKDCEQRGDSLETEILGKLSATFITPIDREDIHDIVTELGVLVVALRKNRSIDASISSMHRLENEADLLFHHCMFGLFRDGYPAVEILKMKEIYERLEGVIDTVDHVGKRIRGVRVKAG